MAKPRVATTSLSGCFGCHMSLLDIDDALLQLVTMVRFDRSPINDIKKFTTPCQLGFIEGSCANEENVRILQEFRKHCKTLIAVGDCAIMGGIQAMRNTIGLKQCLEEAYLTGPTVYNPSGRIPDDPEIPLLLDRVYSCNEVVKIDCHLPGCPPPADALRQALVALLDNKPVDLPYELIKYD